MSAHLSNSPHQVESNPARNSQSQKFQACRNVSLPKGHRKACALVAGNNCIMTSITRWWLSGKRFSNLLLQTATVQHRSFLQGRGNFPTPHILYCGSSGANPQSSPLGDNGPDVFLCNTFLVTGLLVMTSGAGKAWCYAMVWRSIGGHRWESRHWMMHHSSMVVNPSKV